MSKNVAAVLQLHWMDTRYSFAVFWSTLIACEMVLFLLVWFFAGGVVMFSGWLAVYVFALIGGAVTMNSTFPVAVGWSVPRKDVYVATMIHYVLACLALAVIYMIMYSVEKGMMSLLVGGRFHFFTLPGEVEGEPSVWLMLWVHFIVAWTLMAVGHFFGCLYYRYGRFGIFFFYRFVCVFDGAAQAFRGVELDRTAAECHRFVRGIYTVARSVECGRLCGGMAVLAESAG